MSRKACHVGPGPTRNLDVDHLLHRHLHAPLHHLGDRPVHHLRGPPVLLHRGVDSWLLDARDEPEMHRTRPGMAQATNPSPVGVKNARRRARLGRADLVNILLHREIHEALRIFDGYRLQVHTQMSISACENHLLQLSHAFSTSFSTGTSMIR